MEFSPIPYAGNSPFTPWPLLAGNAFLLQSRGGESLFFFDVPPAGGVSLSAAPVFVLIHGLGDEADSWRRLIPLLAARGYRTLALDLPGFGRSAAGGKTGRKKHAAAVLSLLDAAGISGETPVFLAGNSMGALVAEEAAFQRSELVRGLILVDGSIPGGPARPGFSAFVKMLFSRKWYRAYRGNPEAAWRSLYQYYADLESMPREDKEFLKERVMVRVESPSQERAYFATQRSLVRAFLTASSRFARKVRAFRGEILLVWGEKDRIVPLSSAEAFKALRGGIGLETIPGAGHLPHQEKPAETARIMADFVDRVLNL